MSPPPEIARLLDTPSGPVVFPSPARDHIALLSRPGLPSIAAVAEPSLGLAGELINPRSNGPRRALAYDGISLRDLRSGTVREVSLPEPVRVTTPVWSPDGERLAFLVLLHAGVELWAADVSSGRARRLAGGVNAAFPSPFEWLPDSSGLLVRRVPEGRGGVPQPERVPDGPVVQESEGPTEPRPTLRNLLRSPLHEALFEHYFTSQLELAKLGGSTPRPIGTPGLIASTSISPDGRFILQRRLKRPFSYTVSASSFPAESIVTDMEGEAVYRVADHPMRDGAVASGARSIHWRADASATLAWAEAVDRAGADSPDRDRVYVLKAPFTGCPRVLVELEGRYVRTLWGRDDFALVIASSRRDRSESWIAVDPAHPGTGRLLRTRPFSGGTVGTPLLRRNGSGQEMLHFTPDRRGVFTRGRGGLFRLELVTGDTEPTWRPSSSPYERFVALLDDQGERLLTWRESSADPPNLFVSDRRGGQPRQITEFADPAPELAEIGRRTITYERADGVTLSATVYLPPGHDSAREGTTLPVLIWAYPVAFPDVATFTAGSGNRNENRFVRPDGIYPPLQLVASGYAVVKADMPIVGSEGRPPNASFVEQLADNARAAVDALVRFGVADRERIAIAGHSYGASMVANLLAHTDLFRTGIAMSGAYNRTLTPFGFQTERRTLWEATDSYLDMSPFIHADDVNEPVLLLHGAMDPNAGTLPMQSERFYAALKGNGTTARYVLLPFEGHHYRARESVMHTMWEVTRWLDLYLRDLPDPGARPSVE